ncbi:unnamed protein product [Parnassius apollo]|uniref:(apollo) hypothetical protein n=1 Tax=Parnassius apollo TaxID=110799 RepID=A0A8S3WH24_PARAO|nr:unnamed protein product [Parnassius apollo]
MRRAERGPQADGEQRARVLRLIESGKRQGARLVAGGERTGHVGYFVQPTMFCDVGDHMDIARRELFGPVRQIMKFSQIDDLLECANDTHYDLVATNFTGDLDRANYFTQGLRAGTV